MTTNSSTSSTSSTKKSRFSISGLTSGSKSSKRESLLRIASTITDNGLSYLGESYSEVSASSSASQIRTMSKVIGERLDKMSISTRSAISSGASDWVNKMGFKNEEGPDRLSTRGRNLELILEAGMGVSMKLQTFFEKNNDVLGDNPKARDLKMQNEQILEGDWGMTMEIVVCGDNGSGKSSLINALLDIECITPISNSNSCTATPIEFRARDRAQKTNFKYTVTSILLTQAEWLPLATQLLADIGEDPADMKCITARGILKSLFGLSEESSVDLEDIQVIPGSLGHLEKFSTQDISEVNKHIQELNSEYWAILKKITIYMDSPVLNTGVVLIDLPGLGKINPMKLATVNEYLKSCENVVVVSDISRVGIDEDLLMNPIFEPIASRAQLEPPLKFAFILTQIDNIPRVTSDPKWDKKREILSRVEDKRAIIQNSPKSRLNTSKVIFTSSLEYQWHHRRLLQPKTTSCISPEESGIPSLRRFIQEKGLQRREAVVKSLVEGNMTIFMNSVQNWCNEKESVPPTPEEEVIAPEEKLMAPEEKLMTPEELQMYFEGMKKKTRHIIITDFSSPLKALYESLDEKINDNDLLRANAKEAEKIINDSMDVHWQTLKSNFRNPDTFISWKEGIADRLVNIVNKHWEEVFNPGGTAIPSIFKNLTDTVLGVISEAVDLTTDSDKIASELTPIVARTCNAIRFQEDAWQLGLRETNEFVTGNQDILHPKLLTLYTEIRGIQGNKIIERCQGLSTEKLPDLVFNHYKVVCNKVYDNLQDLVEMMEEETIDEFDKVLDDVRSNYSPKKPVEIKPRVYVDLKPRVYVDLKPVKQELMELCKYMKQLEFLAMRPRVTVEGNL
ncbi:P-loop containing nucleoside triphosphate hydrolase protein [Morchella snyderi]|nr:P-loop containing nucleoside triphosphate hydrolase protein [Morchella snyderi]